MSGERVSIGTTSACIRGCAMYQRHLDECTGFNDLGRVCRGCLPRRASTGMLCDTCYRRLQLMLHDAPTVYRWLTGNMASGEGAVRAHQDYERGGTPDLPAPVKVAVMDIRDLMADQLTEWVDEWCERKTLTGPGRHTVAVDAEFLGRWLPGICSLDWIGDWWETLGETMSQAHALAPWRPEMKRVSGVPCPECGETNLAIFGGESDVTCLSCRILIPEAHFGLWEQIIEGGKVAS